MNGIQMLLIFECFLGNQLLMCIKWVFFCSVQKQNTMKFNVLEMYKQIMEVLIPF